MPNPTSLSESGIPTGSDPSRGPPSWARLQPDAGTLRPPGCYVTHRPCLVSRPENETPGRRWYAVVSETRGASEAEGTMDHHAVVSETRGKRGRFTSENKRRE